MTVSPTIPTIRSRISTDLFHRPCNGWIGVDVGTATIKLAQVERRGNRWRLAASLIVQRDDVSAGQSNDSEGLVQRALRSVATMTAGFKGRRTACLLPTSVMEFQTFDIPDSSDDETEQMIQQELEGSAEGDGEPREFGFWRTSDSSTKKDVSPVTVVSVSRRIASAAAAGLLDAGLRCQVIDGLPFALSRAASMALPNHEVQPVATLSWGYSSALLTIAKNGQPVFARSLRDCSLSEWINPICENLGISPDECRHMLAMYGLNASPNRPAAEDVSEAISQLTADPLNRIVDELRKTLSYVQQQFPNLVPDRLLLFGGGATIRNIAATLTQSVGIESTVWQLTPELADRPESIDPSQALLGPAIALSALAGAS